MKKTMKREGPATAVDLQSRSRRGAVKLAELITHPDQIKTSRWKNAVVGDFRLVSLLGQGGMGIVFKAVQKSLGRPVALKVLYSDLARNAAFRERLLREARAVARLNHPNIVAGLDTGKAAGVYYFAMEYVEGECLDTLRKRKGGKLPEREALQIIRRIALALEHAHAAGLLHRDVKPGNILIDRDRTPKLTDLGLVGLGLGDVDSEDLETPGRDGPKDSSITRHGSVVGTPYYISPEQACGERNLTPATDLYALGATLFLLLTGSVPYPGESPKKVMKKHLREPVPDPRSIEPSISYPTARVCMRLMQKEPGDRFRRGNVLADEVKRVLERLPREASKSRRRNAGGDKLTTPAVRLVETSRSKLPPLRRKHNRTDVPTGLVAGLAGLPLLLLAYLFLFAGGEHSSRRGTDLPQHARSKHAVSPNHRTAKWSPNRDAQSAGNSTAAPAGPRPAVSADGPPPALPLYLRPYNHRAGSAPVPRTQSAAGPRPVVLPAVEAGSNERQGADRAAEDEQFLSKFGAHLRKAELAKAEELVKAAPSNVGRDLTVYASQALGVMRDLANTWRDAKQKLKGSHVALSGLSGKVTGTTEKGLVLEVADGVERFHAWSRIEARDVLRLLGMSGDESDPDLRFRRGVFLFYRGSVLEGAEALLQSENADRRLPGPLRDLLDRIRTEAALELAQTDLTKLRHLAGDGKWSALATELTRFERKHAVAAEGLSEEINGWRRRIREAAAAAAKKKEEAAPEPIEAKKEPDRPRKVVATGRIEEILGGEVREWNRGRGYLVIRYPFSGARELADFTPAGGSWQIGKAGALVQNHEKDVGVALLSFTHKARWRTDKDFRLTARIRCLEGGRRVGVGLRTNPKGEPSHLVTTSIGSDGNLASGTHGAGLFVIGPGEARVRRPYWAYKPDTDYLLSLFNKDAYWIGKVDDWKDRRTRDDASRIETGHVTVVSMATRIEVDELEIAGHLDQAWLKKVLK